MSSCKSLPADTNRGAALFRVYPQAPRLSHVCGLGCGERQGLALEPLPTPTATRTGRVSCQVSRHTCGELYSRCQWRRRPTRGRCEVFCGRNDWQRQHTTQLLARPLERGAWPPLYNVCTSAESAARGSATIFYLHKSSTDAVLYSLPQCIYSSHSASARVTMPLPDPKSRNSCSMCPVCSSLDYVPRVCSRALKESRPSNASGRRACRHHPNTQHLRCATWQAQAV